MSNILLKKLAERYTLNTNPDVATTVEQGLMQLSSGIYTEEERFIFELLQNAVDSYDVFITIEQPKLIRNIRV